MAHGQAVASGERSQHYDLLVIGGGSAAFAAAIAARDRGGALLEFPVEQVLVATGRMPNTVRMGLEEAGLRLDHVHQPPDRVCRSHGGPGSRGWAPGRARKIRSR